MSHPLHKTRQRQEQLELAGLIAICVALVIQILGSETRDMALTIAVYCFAASLPFLALCALVTTVPLLYEVTYKELLYGLTSLLSQLVAIIGISCVFWHFSFMVGIVFGIASITSIVLWYKATESTELYAIAEKAEGVDPADNAS